MRLPCGKLVACDTAGSTGSLDLLILNCWALALLVCSLPPAIWYLRRLRAEQAAEEEAIQQAPPPDPQVNLRPRKRRR